MEKVYSNNREDWVGDFQTAWEYSADECLYDHDKPIVYVGDAVPVTHLSLCDGLSSQVIGILQELAFDQAGEHTDGYLDELDTEKLLSLDAAICKWLNDNAGEPNAYKVINIKEQSNDK
jgi:hypothetical protein